MEDRNLSKQIEEALERADEKVRKRIGIEILARTYFYLKHEGEKYRGKIHARLVQRTAIGSDLYQSYNSSVDALKFLHEHSMEYFDIHSDNFKAALKEKCLLKRPFPGRKSRSP